MLKGVSVCLEQSGVSSAQGLMALLSVIRQARMAATQLDLGIVTSQNDKRILRAVAYIRRGQDRSATRPDSSRQHAVEKPKNLSQSHLNNREMLDALKLSKSAVSIRPIKGSMQGIGARTSKVLRANTDKER